MSDHGARGDCLPLGTGELDLAALLGRVRGYGFDGGVMLELYRDSYGGYSELDDSYARILAAIRAENG